jgi:hypothetical protein
MSAKGQKRTYATPLISPSAPAQVGCADLRTEWDRVEIDLVGRVVILRGTEAAAERFPCPLGEASISILTVDAIFSEY